VCDDGSPTPVLCDQATLTISVSPINDAPVANNDTKTINEDDPATTVDVISNDTDIDGTPSTISIVNGPTAAQGTASVNGAGDINFTPTQDYNGIVIITYQVCDNGTPMPAACDQATLTITVNAINDAPVANDEALTILEDAAPTNVNILANDSDVDGNISQVLIQVGPNSAQGTASLSPTNEIIFTPAVDFNGVVSIQYSICDDGTPLPAACDQATLTITVTPVNDAPKSGTDYYTVFEYDQMEQ